MERISLISRDRMTGWILRLRDLSSVRGKITNLKQQLGTVQSSSNATGEYYINSMSVSVMPNQITSKYLTSNVESRLCIQWVKVKFIAVRKLSYDTIIYILRLHGAGSKYLRYSQR